MKISIIITILWFTLFGCEERTTRWEYDIKNGCSLPDAHYIEATFTPSKYRIWVKGNLKSSATMFLNISDNQNDKGMSSNMVNFESGKVDYKGEGDLYQKGLMIIYIPKNLINETEETGKLSVIIEIE